MDEKALMGWLAVGIMAAAYAFQIWRTLFGKSQPNPIAWVGFGFLTGVGYFAAVQKGAASGSWVMGFTSLCCFVVAGVSWFAHKERWMRKDGFPLANWVALAAGVILFTFYLTCKHFAWGPVLAAVLAASADVVLYEPIFHDTWHTPHNECATAYALNSAKFVPSLFAMGQVTLTTVVYPSTLIVANAAVVVWLLWRRQVVPPLA